MGRLYPADLINYYYPVAELVSSRLAAGGIPLWDPGLCSGMPFFATLQPGVLYPGNWLGVWIPVEMALPLRMFLEIVLGSWFAAMFFRSWGVGLLAASFGGALFAFGCLLGMTFWPPVVATIVWLPWILLCVEKLICRWSFGWWLGFVAGLSIQLFAGFPQFVVYSLYLVVPYTALRLGENAWKGTSSPRATASCAAGLLLGGALGLGIAAVQLLPALELVENSARSGVLDARDLHYRNVTATASTLLKTAIDPAPKLVTLDGNSAGYLGIPTVLMVVLGCVGGFRSPRLWLFMTLGALGLLLSDGLRATDTTLFSIYTSLPTGDLFRAPERLRLLWIFGLIVVAVRGFDQVDRGFDGPGSRSRRVAAGLALASAFVVIAVWGSWRAIGLAVATLFLVVAIRGASGNPRLRWVPRLALFGLVLFDLNHATGAYGSLRDFSSTLPRSFSVYGQPVVDGATFADLRDEAGLGRLAFSGDASRLQVVSPFVGAPPIDGGYRISCYGPLLPRQWSELSERLRIPDAIPVLAALDIDQHADVYDLTSVDPILQIEVGREESSEPGEAGLASEPLEELEPQPLNPPARRVSVIPNPDALPRAYWSERYAVREDDEILDEIVGGSFDPHERVLVDAAPSFRSADEEGTSIHSAKILSYGPERVEIQVDAPREGLLVLTDTHYPGWRAHLGESELSIFRAHGLHRAVQVPAGRHRVTFEYVPGSFRRGAVISALCLTGAILVAALGAAATRTRPPRAAHLP